MKTQTTVILDASERTMLAELANNLASVCVNMNCGGYNCRENCPLDSITDHAHDLADEIREFLAKCK